MSKRALCVGINDYPGTDSDLAGCVNDALDWSAELRDRGYAVDTLLDKDATRDRLVQALERLVASGQPGDSLVFTFSGHGSWLPDASGDEPDARDEMLCPHDIHSQKYLLDDDLAELFGAKKRGVELFFISDSCHSGSVSRIPRPAAGERARSPRFLPPTYFLSATQALRLESLPAVPATRQKYPALLLAGCSDLEFSYDAWFGERPNGALTRTAIDALRKNPISPSAWLKEIRKRLPSPQHPQTPALFGRREAKSGRMF